MSSFIPIKGKTGECDPHRPPVPEAYYTKRETDALLATKVSFDQFNNHTLNTTVHITAEERAAWNNKITEPAEEGSAGDVLVTDGEGGRTWSASPTHTATWGQITGTLSNQTDLHTRLTTDETNISNEVTRATSAEGLLGQRITTETTRATNAESVLTSSIAAEVTRAQGAESTLTTNLSNEITRATGVESGLNTSISNEVTRATGAEATLQSNITAENTRAEEAELIIQQNLESEATRAQGAESTLTTNLAAEVTRATGVEATKENISNKVTEILSTSTHTEYASAKSVYDAISAIPKALVYKGTIGVGGTIQVLPEATEDRGGWTYKVITEAIYPPMTEKASIGDLIVCAWEEEPQPEGTYKWTLIPAGAEKVKDVQINGTSILSDAGVANIPYAVTGNNKFGVVKVFGGTYGIEASDGDGLKIINPTTSEIDTRNSGRKPINASLIDYAVKAALTDGVGPDYTDYEKESAQQRLGVTAAIAEEATRALSAEASLESDIDNEVTRATSAEGTLTSNLSSEITRATTAETNLQTAVNSKVSNVKINGTSIVDANKCANISLADSNTAGVMKVGSGLYYEDDGNVYVHFAPPGDVCFREQDAALCSYVIPEVMIDGLCNDTDPEWDESQKTLAQNRIGVTEKLASKISDVKINGTSVVDANKCANIPVASWDNLGAIKLGTGFTFNPSDNTTSVYYTYPGDVSMRSSYESLNPSLVPEIIIDGLCNEYDPAWSTYQKESAQTRIGVKSEIERIDNYIDGNLNGKTTNTEVANIKNLPTNVYSTTVNDIGGNSIVWNQLIDEDTSSWKTEQAPNKNFTYYVKPQAGHQYYVHEESYKDNDTYNFVSIGFWNEAMTSFSRIQLTSRPNNSSSTIYTFSTPSGHTIDEYVKFTFQYIGNDQTVSGVKYRRFQLFDLTLMFGAGNEPSTVAEFEAMFPNSYYPYSVPTVTHAAVDKVIYQGLNLFNHDDATTIEGYKAIRYDRPVAVRIDFKSGVTSVPTGTYVGVIYKNDGASSYSATWFYANTAWSRRVCINGGSGYDNVLVGCYPATALQYFDISVYENDYTTEADVPPITPYYHTEVNIPTAVQQLEGYGWGIGNYYNEVNYSTKKYIKRVGTYTFTGNETGWEIATPATYIHTSGFDLIYRGLTFSQSGEVICKSNYFVGATAGRGIWGRDEDIWKMCLNAGNQMHFNIPHSETGTSSTSTAAECIAAFKTWLQAKATAGNPLTVYYVLATSTETDITSLLTNTDIIKDTVTKNHITAQFNNALQLPMYSSITSTSKKSVVNDVTINNTSIVTDGVANIPIARYDRLGVAKANGTGVSIVASSGLLRTEKASTTLIDERSDNFNPIVSSNLKYAVDSVLCSTSASEALTDEQKTAARTRIGAQKSKFFDVTYGTTTYDEITAAVEAGLTPICTYSYSSSETNMFFTYAGASTSYHYFNRPATTGGTMRYLRVNTSNTWTNGTNTPEVPYTLREAPPAYVGSTGLTQYKICAFDVDNRLVAMSIGNTTANTKTPCTVPFRPETIYMYGTSSTKVEGNTTASGALYSSYHNSYGNYTFNETFPAYHYVYLCGSYDKTTGLFTLDQGQTDGVYNKFYKFVPANASGLTLNNYFETGKYYIKIGRSSTSVSGTFQLIDNKPMYYFNGTSLVDGKEDFHVMDATSFESLPVRSGYYFVY